MYCYFFMTNLRGQKEVKHRRSAGSVFTFSLTLKPYDGVVRVPVLSDLQRALSEEGALLASTWSEQTQLRPTNLREGKIKGLKLPRTAGTRLYAPQA